VLDGLDQIEEKGKSLLWLPGLFPNNVRVIVTVSSESTMYDTCARKGWNASLSVSCEQHSVVRAKTHAWLTVGLFEESREETTYRGIPEQIQQEAQSRTGFPLSRLEANVKSFVLGGCSGSTSCVWRVRPTYLVYRRFTASSRLDFPFQRRKWSFGINFNFWF
jgi:hypothetical protein